VLFRALRDVSHARDAWTNYSRSNDIPEHLAIVRALQAQDADLAALTMDRHIRSAARNLEEVVFELPRPAAAPPASEAPPGEPPGAAPAARPARLPLIRPETARR